MGAIEWNGESWQQLPTTPWEHQDPKIDQKTRLRSQNWPKTSSRSQDWPKIRLKSRKFPKVDQDIKAAQSTTHILKLIKTSPVSKGVHPKSERPWRPVSANLFFFSTKRYADNRELILCFFELYFFVWLILNNWKLFCAENIWQFGRNLLIRHINETTRDPARINISLDSPRTPNYTLS